MDRLLLALAALHGLIAVAAGAFGAHGLRGRLTPELLSAWQTGAHYQLLHAAAALALALTIGLAPLAAQGWLRGAAWAWIGGLLLFSGSLYLLALGGPRWLGPVTPLGGTALLAGWACVLLAAWRGAGGSA